MPFAVISLRQGTDIQHRRAIADGVHEAMMHALGIPADDRFQVINEYPVEHFIHDRMFVGVERSERSVFVQITINQRPLAQKQALYERIANNLASSPGIRKQDVFINLVEVARENWWAFARAPDAHVAGPEPAPPPDRR